MQDALEFHLHGERIEDDEELRLHVLGYNSYYTRCLACRPHNTHRFEVRSHRIRTAGGYLAHPLLTTRKYPYVVLRVCAEEPECVAAWL